MKERLEIVTKQGVATIATLVSLALPASSRQGHPENTNTPTEHRV